MDRYEREYEAREKRCVAYWEQIEKQLNSTLRVEPLAPNANQHSIETYKTTRHIVDQEGNRVGRVHLSTTGFSFSRKDSLVLTSPRISSRVSGAEGSRRYGKIDSLIAGINKFCMPVTADELRAKEIKVALNRTRNKLDGARDRSRTVGKARWYVTKAYELIDLIDSDDPAEQERGLRLFEELRRKRRVFRRFEAWVTKNVIKPLQAEYNELDTSREIIE